MGARQSTPAEGEGGSISSSNSPRLFGTGNGGPGSSSRSGEGQQHRSGRTIGIPSIDIRQRARSLSNVMSGAAASASHGMSMAGLPFGLPASGSPDSDTSNEDIAASFGRGLFSAHSLPVQIVPFNGEF